MPCNCTTRWRQSTYIQGPATPGRRKKASRIPRASRRTRATGIALRMATPRIGRRCFGTASAGKAAGGLGGLRACGISLQLPVSGSFVFQQQALNGAG